MSRIPDEIVQAVREANDLIEVASEYLELHKQGNYYVALCFRPHGGTEEYPIYEDNPSLTFQRDPETGEWRYYCYTCGLGRNESEADKGPSNVFKFVQQYYRYVHKQELDFPTVVRMLGERVGIEVPPPTPPDPEVERLKEAATKRNRDLWQNLMNDQQALDYLINERGLSMDDIRNPHFRLGLVGPNDPYKNARNRIAFGVCEVTHNPATARTIGFQYRLRPGVECGAPEQKYVVDFETKIWKKGANLYLLHAAAPEIRKRGYAHVVEGNFDAIWMHKVGFTNTVATMGTALTPEMRALLRRYTRKIFLWVEDDAGVEALRRQLPDMLRDGFEVMVVVTGGKDPDEICRKKGANGVLAYIQSKAKPAIQFILDEAKARYDAVMYQAKQRALNEVLPILSAIRSPAAKLIYLGTIQEHYGVPAQIILQEYTAQQQTSAPARSNLTIRV